MSQEVSVLDRLRIEYSLRRAEQVTGKPLHAKYMVLKDRLFTQEYGHWATAFPGGNDHGPLHIERVLEKLDQLVDGNPPGEHLLRPYELYLTMMSVLYHDIGMLQGRNNHADSSSLLVEEEHNDYLVHSNDRDIISAIVVSHSSTKDIAEETSRFSEEELIGDQSVRPRVMAALVRLADELDEDFRRADPLLQSRLDLPAESRFYWEFCQRIRGIQPVKAAHRINIDVKFEEEDAGRTVLIGGRQRPFLSVFGEKLAKINRERATVVPFLPESLRYHYVKLSVKPLPRHKTWRHPRDFIFGQYTSSSDFVAAFPELLAEPASKWLLDTLRHMRSGDLEKASSSLNRLGSVIQDLPTRMRLIFFYDAACLESLKASAAVRDDQRDELLALSLNYLSQWVRLLVDENWEADGQDPYNEIFRMTRDGDLHCVLAMRRHVILQMLPMELREAVSETPPDEVAVGKGGCFPRGALVTTLNGQVPIEDLREGDKVVSIDTEVPSKAIGTGILRIRTLREAHCVVLNGRYVLTPSQPILGKDGIFIRAGDLCVGASILGPSMDEELIEDVAAVDSYFEVYALTTDHRSHNYVVDDRLICHNAKMW
jgi:hypothetical protein